MRQAPGTGERLTSSLPLSVTTSSVHFTVLLVHYIPIFTRSISWGGERGERHSVGGVEVDEVGREGRQHHSAGSQDTTLLHSHLLGHLQLGILHVSGEPTHCPPGLPG